MGEQSQPKVIKVQKVHPESEDNDYRELLATLCYYYPQYTYAQARKLPFHRVQHLVKVANKIEATKLYNLTQIAAAPHSDKGKAVKQLLKNFEEIMNG